MIRAVCDCGLVVDADCVTNAHLLLASDIRHLHIEGERVEHDLPLRVKRVELRPHGYMYVPAVHASERAVVWRHPATGEIAYPGKNNIPMPERYRKRGFERHELASLRQMDRFEHTHKVRNERIHFDSNGKADRE